MESGPVASYPPSATELGICPHMAQMAEEAEPPGKVPASAPKAASWSPLYPEIWTQLCKNKSRCFME